MIVQIVLKNDGFAIKQMPYFQTDPYFLLSVVSSKAGLCAGSKGGPATSDHLALFKFRNVDCKF